MWRQGWLLWSSRCIRDASGSDNFAESSALGFFSASQDAFGWALSAAVVALRHSLSAGLCR